LAFLCVFNAYPAIQKYIINPHYESTGEQNPETPDFDAKSKKADKNTASVEKPNIFTDLGGQERPINKKSVKTSGKIIK
ncbi:MAG: hypothetical protein FWG45_05090, partial [Oscillospiraceae bacterium]|nr:hypothetical protein [Oscillospiraceae bacterium]